MPGQQSPGQYGWRRPDQCRQDRPASRASGTPAGGARRNDGDCRWWGVAVPRRLRIDRAFIARRRSARPSQEYRVPTDEEWAEFLGHFEHRKVALGDFGVSGRAMMAALIAGQRNPRALAQLARARMRAKITALEEAFTGHFTDHHAFLVGKMLARVDQISAVIADLDTKIEELVAPFVAAVARLDEVPGIGPVAAAAVIAEIGIDMSRFPTPGHLASWAKFAPGVKESAGKKKGKGSTGHGDPYLARVLGEAAVSASKTDTFLGERYRRIARRHGKKRPLSRSADPSW